MMTYENYRYTLTREWPRQLAGGRGSITWVMLNPSTADAVHDDPTIRRVCRFSREAGYDSLTVVNLFAWRSSQPGQMRGCVDPVGPRNVEALEAAFYGAAAVVFAWGAWWSANRNRIAANPPPVEQMVRRCGHAPLCLGMTVAGGPRHPLYVRADQPLVPYTGTLVPA